MQNIKNITIPSTASDYFSSLKAADLNILITQKYKIGSKDLPKYLGLVKDLFYKKMPLSGLVYAIKELFSFDDVKAGEMAIDMAGVLLLVVKDWIGDVDGYIRKLGGDPAKYAKFTVEHMAAVKKEKEDWEAELKKDKERQAELLSEKVLVENLTENVFVDIDPEKEKTDSLTIFSSQLNDFLSTSSPYLLDEYNRVLIQIISDEKGFSFRDRLVKALLENKEVASSSPFFLTKKPAVGTISNWLKYFIEEKGSGPFDNIVLTDFLVKSANARILKDEEKEKIKKLLLIYRNLKFFPDSMPSKTGEGWAIIPVDMDNEGVAAKTLSVPSTDDFAVGSNDIKSKKQQEKEEELAAENAKELAHMKELVENYPAKSLERKAIEGEISKLEAKIKK